MLGHLVVKLDETCTSCSPVLQHGARYTKC